MANSLAPCCQSAWLEILQVGEPSAYTAVSSQADFWSVSFRTSARNATTDNADISEALSFSSNRAISTTRSTGMCPTSTRASGA